MSGKKSMDLFKILSTEAESYRTLDQIESLVEDNNENEDQKGANHDLAPLPIQPLYLALKTLSSDQIVEYLPRLSREQRTAFLDIDLWQRDELDIDSFNYWLCAYQATESEEVIQDFVTSEQFALFLKGKFNIWTFDVEDPEYPDHDYYFLTEDNQLLIEYDEHFQYVDELKDLIRALYSYLGVENAYSHLFKIVADSFMSLQEEEYRLKKERQRDFGFVDYFEALDIDTPFVHFEQMHGFVNRKTKENVIATDLSDQSKNQTLHLSSLIPFRDHFNSVVEELNKIKDQNRIDFLQFNFVRLLNAEIELDSALKKGSMAMNRSGARVKNLLTLAVNYLNSIPIRNQFVKQDEHDSLLSKLDFVDLYRIGNSLFKIPKKELKKALAKFRFEGDAESFLGKNWEDFLDLSFEENVKFVTKNAKGNKAEIILSFEDYEEWRYKMKTLQDLLPFAHKFHETFAGLKKDGRIQDSYYLNYTVDSIDFEALFLSSFANHFLGSYAEENTSKLGLTIDEFKSFSSKIVTREGRFVLTPELYQKIQFFLKTFGLDQITGANNYLQSLLAEHLEGYDFETLDFEDFKHVGGPIILNRLKH